LSLQSCSHQNWSSFHSNSTTTNKPKKSNHKLKQNNNCTISQGKRAQEVVFGAEVVDFNVILVAKIHHDRAGVRGVDLLVSKST
jgi:hypothetical protein